MKNNINHLSFIMDGNARWAKKNNCKLIDSYTNGAQNLLELTEYLFKKHNIKNVSAFTLSKHNLNRSKMQINTIIKVFEYYLNEIINNKNLYQFNIIFIGDYSYFNDDIRDKISIIKKRSIKSNNNLILAINYSSRLDIEKASKEFSKSKNQKFNYYLSTKNIPDPDILLRTGGFQRISDFFLYEMSFTELFFIKTLWPDLNKKKLSQIIKKFYDIERKFGK